MDNKIGSKIENLFFLLKKRIMLNRGIKYNILCSGIKIFICKEIAVKNIIKLLNLNKDEIFD
ncbi:MAG: hypothetical protein ACPLWB_03525 [Caldisericia bacterium]